MRQILCLILTFSLLLCGCSSFQSEKVELSGSTEQTETSEEKLSESSTPQSDSPENDAQENTSREIFSDEQNPSKESPFLLCAYLPTSSAPDDLSPYAQNIALLDYLVLNTDVYWDEMVNSLSPIIFLRLFRLWMVKPSSGVPSIHKEN